MLLRFVGGAEMLHEFTLQSNLRTDQVPTVLAVKLEGSMPETINLFALEIDPYGAIVLPERKCIDLEELKKGIDFTVSEVNDPQAFVRISLVAFNHRIASLRHILGLPTLKPGAP